MRGQVWVGMPVDATFQVVTCFQLLRLGCQLVVQGGAAPSAIGRVRVQDRFAAIMRHSSVREGVR